MGVRVPQVMRVAAQKGGRWRIEMCCQVQRVAARMMAGTCNAAVAHACFWLLERRPSQRLGVMLISVLGVERRTTENEMEAAARLAKRREAAKECRGRSTTRVQNLDPSHSQSSETPKPPVLPDAERWERGKWRKGLADAAEERYVVLSPVWKAHFRGWRCRTSWCCCRPSWSW